MGTHAFRVTAGRRTFRAPHGAHVDAFRHLDVEVATGEIFVLLGASGCGKSTFLRVLAGLDHLTEGSLDLDAEVDRAGIAFQEPRLLPWLTVRENVALGLRFRANRHLAGVDVDALLETFDIAPLAEHVPAELSGGQAQRVALARAAVVRPGLLLLDEPFAALDPVIRRELQDWLLGIRDDLGATVVLVTHDVDEAVRVGDRIGVLRAGAGLVGTWDVESHDPADLRAALRAAYAGPTDATGADDTAVYDATRPVTVGPADPADRAPTPDPGAAPAATGTPNLLEVAP